MNKPLKHDEIIQSSILDAIEGIFDELTKEQQDALIMLYIESDILEE